MNSAPKDKRVSHAPTMTSVYSQPYDLSNPSAQPPVHSNYYGDISPPGSPQLYASGKAHGSGDVSPIENDIGSDIHPAFRVNQKKTTNTHIPVLRKVTPGSSTPPNSSVDTRWDKYSGEPTTGPTGLASQVKPGSALPILTGKRGPGQAKGAAPELDKSRLKSVTERAATLDKGLAIDTRPPWKGASGRTTLVPAPADKPERTMPMPMRDSKKHTDLPSPRSRHARPDVAQEAETESASTREGDINHSPKPGHPTTSRSTKAPGIGSTGYGPDSYPSPVSVNGYPADKSEHQPVRPPFTPVHRNQHSTGNASKKSMDYSPGQQQDSRFSWTTQATNTTYQRSPPPSPPPMPALPSTIKAVPASTGGVVMSRTRPIPSSKNSPTVPSSAVITTSARKPVASLYSESTETLRHYPPHTSGRTASLASTIAGPKALPPTPMEANSQDHVESLQAQLDDLFTQRSNVQRVLRDLLKPEASNPLTTTFRGEREREKRVQALREELNEIALAEHDVGLKLHRAHKKREREEGGEGTTLWIKRVTS